MYPDQSPNETRALILVSSVQRNPKQERRTGLPDREEALRPDAHTIIIGPGAQGGIAQKTLNRPDWLGPATGTFSRSRHPRFFCILPHKPPDKQRRNGQIRARAGIYALRFEA